MHKIEGIHDYVHTDLWGPINIESQNGHMYFVSFIENYIRKTWVYFMQLKLETFAKFKLWRAKAENHTGKRIKGLR